MSWWPQAAGRRSAPPAGRRIFELITFGFELEMLKLHMRIMQPEVAGFLEVEATSTYQLSTKGSSPAASPPC